MSEKQDKISLAEPSVSIVVAYRNEEKNLPQLLHSLINQSLKPSAIFLINDHSEDNGKSVAVDFAHRHTEMNIQLFDASENGKKAAFLLACQKSETDIMLSLDADCVVEHNWIESMLNAKRDKQRIVGAPLLYAKRKSFLNPVFRSELFYLVAAGIAGAKIRLPFQISGGAMLFYKNDFIDFAASAYGKSIAHGDDVFFLQFLIHRFGVGSVGMTWQKESLVLTPAPKNVSEFFRQRVRWASKASAYKSAIPFIFGGIVLLKNTLLYLSIFAAFFYQDFQFLILTGILLLSDLIFAFLSAYRIRYSISLWGLTVLLLLYPIYLLIVLIYLPFSINSRWKGRLYYS